MSTDTVGLEGLKTSRLSAADNKDAEVDTDLAQIVMLQIASAANGVGSAADVAFGSMLWNAHLFWNMAETRAEAHERLRKFTELTTAHIDILYDREAGAARSGH